MTRKQETKHPLLFLNLFYPVCIVAMAIILGIGVVEVLISIVNPILRLVVSCLFVLYFPLLLPSFSLTWEELQEYRVTGYHYFIGLVLLVIVLIGNICDMIGSKNFELIRFGWVIHYPATKATIWFALLFGYIHSSGNLQKFRRKHRENCNHGDDN
jgi:hypothetical protein